HYRRFNKLDNVKIIESLIKVKGIGQWTAEMFLIFTLGREDVFSLGDLGLRKAVTLLYRLKETKTLTKRIEKISLKWAPYRSYSSLALWRSLDG
ncbi:MAG: DNA-3-methyladenine glycosylase 2 family protein, partial [Atribacterota bacterium]|nr:DNA-3-methyladenine glycosylase 2 family protein [Atribacterota bacterium]